MVLVDHTRWKLRKKQWTGTTDQLIEDLKAAYVVADCNELLNGLENKDPLQLPPSIKTLEGTTHTFQFYFNSGKRTWDGCATWFPALNGKDPMGLEVNPLRNDQRLWGGDVLIIQWTERKDKRRCHPGPYEEVFALPLMLTKTKASDYGHIKWIEDLVPRTMWIEEPIGYDKHALWGVSHWRRKLRKDDDKLYKFKEGNFKRLRIQDIEDMLLLLVQGKLTNPTIEERFSFNVSLRMFTRSIVIQRRVEDLQLGVESYQKKLNLTKPDTYRSDLKRVKSYQKKLNITKPDTYRSDLKHKEAYTTYPRGFIYQNKDKQNMLIRIDELHKFNDGTLNDVRTTLDDRLKGIRIKYLP
nr:hypothetical protein [Tanacetum cinerariifolium]